jgi:flagellar biosynthesis protein FlhF
MMEQLTFKTYLATTVEAALDLARRELGADALLVSSRPAPEEVRHFGRYEVIFGVEKQSIQPRPKQGVSSKEGPSESSNIRKVLESRGVNSVLVRDLIYSALRRNSTASEKRPLWYLVKDQMEQRIHVDSTLGNIVALTGPPGRGKTTTLLKLAVLKGLTHRLPVRILTADCRRTGACARLQALAASMDIPIQLCATVGELDRALRSSESKGLTLIDTPGYGPRDLVEAGELAAYLSHQSEIHVHLVLRADATTADTVRTVQKYSAFGAKRLVFTGMDEAEAPGPLFSSIVQLEDSLSFLCAGQRIPQDLENASKDRIVDPIFKGLEELISTAA